MNFLCEAVNRGCDDGSMTSTTRIQNRYDHLLREHVQSTGDVNYAIQLGVPRSTARGWVNATPAEVVTLDIVDMDIVRLQQQVLRLQSRLDWVVAVLRLVIVVLKASDISLSNIRIPEGTTKLMLLRAIKRSCCVLSLKVSPYASSACRTPDIMRGSRRQSAISMIYRRVHDARRNNSL